MPVTKGLMFRYRPANATSAAVRMTGVFDVFKVAGNGEPVLIEATQSLKSAMARVLALRESFPGDYLIISRATGRRISFTAHAGKKRN